MHVKLRPQRFRMRHSEGAAESEPSTSGLVISMVMALPLLLFPE